jgi:hypothetical protein
VGWSQYFLLLAPLPRGKMGYGVAAGGAHGRDQTATRPLCIVMGHTRLSPVPSCAVNLEQASYCRQRLAAFGPTGWERSSFFSRSSFSLSIFTHFFIFIRECLLASCLLAVVACFACLACYEEDEERGRL